MPGTWMWEAKADAGNVPCISLGTFSVLLSSSIIGSSARRSTWLIPHHLYPTPISPQSVMLRRQGMCIPNALNHLPTSLWIKLQVPTAIAGLIIHRSSYLYCPVSSLHLPSDMPCTSQINHLYLNPCLRVSFGDNPTWDKDKGHPRKTAVRTNWSPSIKGVTMESRGAERGKNTVFTALIILIFTFLNWVYSASLFIWQVAI